MKVYCVFQASGEYEDYRDELMYICKTRELAEQKAEELDSKIVDPDDVWTIMPENIFWEFDEKIESSDEDPSPESEFKGYTYEQYREQTDRLEASYMNLYCADIREMELEE